MASILGLSASLRGARHGKGLNDLCEKVRLLKTKAELVSYLQEEGAALSETYKKAEQRGLSQLEILESLLKETGRQGLSNSEAALAASLWGAAQENVDIRYCNLSRYFPESGSTRHLDELENIILSVDGFILSTPVYFGDRSSLAQEFIEFLSKNERCLQHIQDKVYGGVSVGAKRNGGQETTLVYQLIDFINLNMLGVGNDSASTSQYGGTVVGGDVGTAVADNYGINTSIDTGRRVAKITKLLSTKSRSHKTEVTKIEIWLVQDDIQKQGLGHIKDLVGSLNLPSTALVTIKDFTTAQIHRCIACDICPTHISEREEYRCIVKKSKDLFFRDHTSIIEADAILLAAYSPVDKKCISSVYQKFIERTRYLRRDDYAIGDILVAPLVISEINSNQNLHIRMTTSLLRHHTIVHHPILLYISDNNTLNHNFAIKQLQLFINNASSINNAKITSGMDLHLDREYQPVGYIISAQKKMIDSKSAALKKIDQK